MVYGRSASTRGIPRCPNHLLLALGPQKLALGPWPQHLDHGCYPSPNPPTAGRRAARVRPWSLAAMPRPRSSSIPHPTHCRPPSRRSSPLVLGRRASTLVVVHPPPHPLQAAEPQEFALGPWPPRLNLGRRPSHTPPTASRRAAGLRPWFLAAAPRPWSSSIPHPTHCRPVSRRSPPSVAGRRASTRVVIHPPTHLLLAPEAQKFALGPWPPRLHPGIRSSPKPRTGIKWARARTQGGSSLPLQVSGSRSGLPSRVVVANKCPRTYTLWATQEATNFNSCEAASYKWPNILNGPRGTPWKPLR